MTTAVWIKKSFQVLLALCVLYAFISNWTTISAKVTEMRRQLVSIRSNGDKPAIGPIQGEAALLIDEKTGQTLYSKNEHERMYPASTTKILTALIALEKCDPDDVVTVGDEVKPREPDESSAGLVPGEQIKLRDLLAALLLPSGNDAARSIARYVTELDTGKPATADEGIRHFAGLMNAKARELGAVESHFVNPSGLHDANHYTTAHDLAIIAQAARENKLFRQIVGEADYKVETPQLTQTYKNRNRLLQRDSAYYDKDASGIKTGYTDEAGYCLVASASRSGKSVIAVVLHSTEAGVWSDAESLLQYGFAVD